MLVESNQYYLNVKPSLTIVEKHGIATPMFPSLTDFVKCTTTFSAAVLITAVCLSSYQVLAERWPTILPIPHSIASLSAPTERASLTSTFTNSSQIAMNRALTETNLKTQACVGGQKNDLQFSSQDSQNEVDQVAIDSKFSRGGLYGASKSGLKLIAKSGQTYVYGQRYLNTPLTKYILCVMRHTRAVARDLIPELGSQPTLQSPTRIIIYDTLEDYSQVYRQAYSRKLDSIVPWGLFETDTISTFIQIQPIDQILPKNLSDYKYRLALNIGHEYFHRLFHEMDYAYDPFLEEGLATYVGGQVVKRVLGAPFDCYYATSQQQLLGDNNQLLVAASKVDAKDWYEDDASTMSRKYALGYFYITYLTQQNQLDNLIHLYPEQLIRPRLDLPSFANFQTTISDPRPSVSSDCSA